MRHDETVDITVVTWNLQGRERPDLVEVAAVLSEYEPDVVLLQEVQRRQARRLAQRLGWYRVWSVKHWPVVIPAEGLAILTPHPLAEVERRVLAMPWSFWSSRRRIAVAATIGGGGLRVVNTHLGSGVGDAERARQARETVSMGDSGPTLVGGDLNTDPGSPVIRVFQDAGFVDAWSAVSDEPGFTNWHAGPRDAPPVQRLDYVLVAGDLSVGGASIPDDVAAVERFGPISDHLPLRVSCVVPG